MYRVPDFTWYGFGPESPEPLNLEPFEEPPQKTMQKTTWSPLLKIERKKVTDCKIGPLCVSIKLRQMHSLHTVN